MIKKNLTLAQGSKAFVMAAFIAISGMYSVQAMQQISPELVTSAEQARVKTRTIKTKSELKDVLDELHNQIITNKKALSKNETARTELTEILRAIQNLISGKTYITEFAADANNAVKEINNTITKLEKNTIGYNFVQDWFAKKNNNTPEDNSAKHDEGTSTWGAWLKNKAKSALIMAPALGSAMLVIGLAGLQLGGLNMSGQPGLYPALPAPISMGGQPSNTCGFSPALPANGALNTFAMCENPQYLFGLVVNYLKDCVKTK